ncbi:MAG: protoporphyrinogen oxidase HemJ [Hyphomicrobiales bacterium]|nr:protoporphyrinogen oxidase HemJ [Hyphomicrobiales bacterium]
MYEWIKVLHVVAIISWMAAILYLPRLMIYHCAAERGSGQSETFKVMERRLLRAIMTPAMIVAWASGLYLAWRGGWLIAGWFHMKLAAVIALSGAHGFLAGQVRVFAEDRNERPARFFRIVNEVPTVLMLVIVAMVIVKPF